MGGYTTVVVGTDGSETSFRAVDRAAALAQRRRRDAGHRLRATSRPATATSRTTRTSSAPRRIRWSGRRPAEDTVSRARDRAVAAGAPRVETVAVQGKPADTLQQVVKEHSADLLVVGNRGLNTLAGRIIGSVPLDVARHTRSTS